MFVFFSLLNHFQTYEEVAAAVTLLKLCMDAYFLHLHCLVTYRCVASCVVKIMDLICSCVGGSTREKSDCCYYLKINWTGRGQPVCLPRNNALSFLVYSKFCSINNGCFRSLSIVSLNVVQKHRDCAAS